MFRLVNSFLPNTRRMKQVLVYKGLGMYEKDTAIIERVMNEHVNCDLYKVDTVSPTEIIRGRLSEGTALLAIGGGYDLGLIEALGVEGMANIKEYVSTGGSYLGICAGAYFACDRIEFDQGGPLEVVGERSLKFCSGVGIGPLFKPYDYKSRKGASAVNIDFLLDKTLQSNSEFKGQKDQIESQNALKESQISVNGMESGKKTSKESQFRKSQVSNTMSSSFNTKVYFNGGCYFKMDEERITDETTVLSQYLDLPDSPAAILRCQVQAGIAVLIGAHLEYDSEDIDDGDEDVLDIIPVLQETSKVRRVVIKSILQELNITVK